MARKTRCRLSVPLTAAFFGVSMICSGFMAPMQVHAEEASKVTSTEELTTFMDVIKRDGQIGHSEYSVNVFTEAKNGISFLVYDRKGEGSGATDNQDEAEEKVSEAFANVAMTTLTGDDYLNIRISPAIDAEVVGKLYAGGTAEIVEVDGDGGWTHIASGSVDGWVSSEYIVTGLDAEKLAFEVCNQIATVQADGLKVRETADPEGAVLNVVYQNETYKVLERQGEWVKIEIKAGQSGYVAAEFVSIELKTGKAISIAEELEAIRIQQEKEAEEARRAEQERQRRAAEQSAASSQATNDRVNVPTTTGPSTPANVDDAYLLACICRVEAGSYDGMLAVANVVLNRVRSGAFPGSVSGVIYQSGQFATGGTFQSYLANGPGGTAIQAANDALAGVNNVGGYLYFRSASTANTASYSSYTMIGGNCFYQR